MPFKSKAQQRFLFAAEARNEVPQGTARRWAHHTPNIKALPEHVKEQKKQADIDLGPMAADSILGAALGSVAGTGAGAERGNAWGGFGRGLVRGGLTGAGFGLGSQLGSQAAHSVLGAAPANEASLPHILASLAGAGLGGAAGWLGSGALLGEPERKPPEDPENMGKMAAANFLLPPPEEKKKKKLGLPMAKEKDPVKVAQLVQKIAAIRRVKHLANSAP